MNFGDVHHRLVTDGEDADDEDSETEDYDDEDGSYQIVDPGTFRYNKRLLVISLPCFLVVLTLTGELLLCIAGIGATMVSVLHTYEEHERSLVVFMVTFLLAQISILYTVLPLIWVSLANLLLIGLLNGYAVMTGCWLVIQLPAFRLQTMATLPSLAAWLCLLWTLEDQCGMFIEKALFSVYPGFCILLWTWAACFVFIPVQFSPFLLLILGFVVLQLFLVPAESSFNVPKLVVKGTQIVDLVMFGVMAAIYAVGPSIVNICVTVLQRHTYASFLQLLVQELFILSASIFLTTFLGLRKLIDHIGWSYDLVVRARWVSGLFLAVTTSPLLKGMGATSPLLSWLPVVVAAYCCYGIFLSFKRHKVFSLGCAIALIVLHIYHVGWLPWRLHYFVPMVGLHISFVHVLILVNATLCLLSAYIATHGSVELLGTLYTLQTVVFITTEIFLKLLGLYSSTLLICTGAVGVYISVRLFQVNKLLRTPAWFSSSCHMTKIAVSILCFVSSNLIGSCVQTSLCLFPLVAFLVYILMFDGQMVISENEAYRYIALVYLFCGLNVYSIGYVVWQATLGGDPCISDLIGVLMSVSGLIIFILSRIHFPVVHIIQHWGPFSIVLGAVVVFLQPDTSGIWVMAEYWGSVITVPIVYAVFSGASYNNLKHIIGLGCLISFFPSSLLVSFVFTDPSLFLHLLWFMVVAGVMLLYLLIFKGDFSIMKREMYTLNVLCGVLSVVGVALAEAVIFIYMGHLSSAVVSRNLSAVTMLALSVAAKIFAIQNQDLPQRLIDEHKLKTRLPLVSNATSAVTFLLLSASCPFEGSPRDLWFVMSSASLLCLQWDNWCLSKFCSRNQMTPMLVVAISILLGSAIYNSAFWELTLSLAVTKGFFEILMILVTFPGYLLFWGFLWTDKILLDEKTIVFVAPLNLVVLLLASSSASFLLGVTGLAMSTWLMGFKFSLEKDPHSVKYYR